MHLILNSQNHSPIIKSTIIDYIFNLTYKYSYNLHVLHFLIIFFRILEDSNFESKILIQFCSTLLSVPVFFKIVKENSEAGLNMVEKILKNSLCEKIFVSLVDSGQITSFMKDSSDINLMISFLGNMCSLCSIDFNCLKINIEKFVVIYHQIFLNISEVISPQKVNSKQQSIRWHPIFGYLKIKTCIKYFFNLIFLFY